MLRRLFWFCSGAVAGVLGLSWARRRAAELRQTLTLESFVDMVRQLLASARQRISSRSNNAQG